MKITWKVKQAWLPVVVRVSPVSVLKNDIPFFRYFGSASKEKD